MLEKYYEEGKKSLDSLVRERAYKNVQEKLEAQKIDIQSLSDEDLEVMVGDEYNNIKEALKGSAIGVLVGIVVSAMIGV